MAIKKNNQTAKNFFYLLSFSTRPNFLYLKPRVFLIKTEKQITLGDDFLKKFLARVNFLVKESVRLNKITSKEAEAYNDFGFKYLKTGDKPEALIENK